MISFDLLIFRPFNYPWMSYASSLRVKKTLKKAKFNQKVIKNQRIIFKIFLLFLIFKESVKVSDYIKPGGCPISTYDPNLMCDFIYPEFHGCRQDSECSDRQKCCANGPCAFMTCKDPIGNLSFINYFTLYL